MDRRCDTCPARHHGDRVDNGHRRAARVQRCRLGQRQAGRRPAVPLSATSSDPKSQSVGAEFDHTANLVSNDFLRWISSNEEVVSIDGNGVATFKSVGRATITVQDKRTNATSPAKLITVLGPHVDAQRVSVQINVLIYEGIAEFRSPNAADTPIVTRKQTERGTSLGKTCR